MPFKSIQPSTLYEKFPQLSKQDVEIVQEWLKKQPHLPKLEESQILGFLHSCYYKIELAKTTIDNYFTVRSLSEDLFVALTPDVLKSVAQVGFATVAPKLTPEGYAVLLIRLTDTKPEHFNCAQIVNLMIMVATLYIHQHGPAEGAVAIFDAKGFALGHLGRLNLTVIKHALYFVQEAAPVRIKAIHIINSFPLVDKVVALVKPFLKGELYNMLQFHPPKSDTLYKTIPKDLLPEEFGGTNSTVKDLNEKNVKNLLDNYEFFPWHDGQKSDESKRIGKPKTVNDVFGMEGTFKKLEID